MPTRYEIPSPASPDYERFAAAHHEAGHACCAVALGHSVRSISIDDDPHPRCDLAYHPSDGHFPTRDAITIRFAGHHAERLIHPFPPRNERDDDEAQQLHERLQSPRHTLIELDREAREMIVPLQHAIRHLARELLQHGTLDGANAERIVRPFLLASKRLFGGRL